MSERGGGGIAGIVLFIGALLIINLLSYVFHWGFIVW